MKSVTGVAAITRAPHHVEYKHDPLTGDVAVLYGQVGTGEWLGLKFHQRGAVTPITQAEVGPIRDGWKYCSPSEAKKRRSLVAMVRLETSLVVPARGGMWDKFKEYQKKYDDDSNETMCAFAAVRAFLEWLDDPMSHERGK